MDVCECLVLSGKKLDSLRRWRSWLGFFWPHGFRSLSNVKRWRGSWPGGWVELVRDRKEKTTPPHNSTSLTRHTVLAPTFLQLEQTVLVTESDKVT